MSDINTCINTYKNTLIKDVAIDVIALTTFWGLLNLNKRNNYLYDNNYIPLYSSILGLGLMTLSIRKYM